MSVLAGARVVTPEKVLEPGWVEISSSRIVRTGVGSPPETAYDLEGAWLLPGFVDTHVHGGGGFDFSASAGSLSDGVSFHRARGTTRILTSLVSAPLDELCDQLGRVARVVASGETPVLGAHVEGPFLSPTSRRGAHRAECLLPVDLAAASRLVDAAGGTLRMLTLAPELPGSIGLIRRLVSAGIIVAIGHTDANYEEAIAGFDAGATVATHLFNGMRPIHHRDPGPVMAALNADTYLEVICDTVHVGTPVVRMLGSRFADRLVLVSDATQAAGAPEGSYGCGERTIEVADGKARLVATGGLAGSTLTMGDALRLSVTEAGLPISVAAAAAATTPATALGVADEFGSISAGRRADLVVLDDDLQVQRVMTDGRWL